MKKEEYDFKNKEMLKNIFTFVVLSSLSILSNDFSSSELSFVFAYLSFLLKANHERNFILVDTSTASYDELKKCYLEFLNNMKNFIVKNDFNNPIAINTAYIYMYRNGYLSSDGVKLKYRGMKDISNLEGIDILSGKGVCRNIASLLTDIYINLGYESQNLYVNFSTIFCPQILISAYLYGNHAVTAVKDSKNSYILDPTNNIIFDRHDGDKYYGKYYIIGKPLINLKNRNFTLLGDNVSDFSIFSDLPLIDRDTYDIKRDKYIKILEDSKDLLVSFYKDNKAIYDEVNAILASYNKQRIRRIF